MSTTVLDAATDTINGPAGAKPLTEGKQSPGMLIALWAFVIIPFAAVIAAVPVAWGWGLTWLDVVMAVTMYMIGGFGIGTGFHRYLTHGSFKAKRWLRITLAVAGSTALQGEVIQWVADHRRHPAFSDLEGDPHPPVVPPDHRCLVPRAGRGRWRDHLVVAGRAARVLLGPAGPGVAAAPHHLVDQLDLPRVRRAAVRA